MDMIQDWMIINKIKMGDPDAWDILVHLMKWLPFLFDIYLRQQYMP